MCFADVTAECVLDMFGVRSVILVFRINPDLLVLLYVVLYFRPNGCICLSWVSLPRSHAATVFDPKDLGYGVFIHCAFLPWNSSSRVYGPTRHGLLLCWFLSCCQRLFLVFCCCWISVFPYGIWHLGWLRTCVRLE